MSNEFTDVEFEEVKPKVYYTIPQIAEIIGEEEGRTRYWGNEFGKEVLVEKIDGRRKFSEESIVRFKQIKELINKHKFSKNQIIKYFEEQDLKRGEKYSDYSNATELLNPKDPLGMEVLAAQLTVKMSQEIDDKLNNFLKNLIEYQEEYKRDLIVQVKTEVANEVIDEIRKESSSLGKILYTIPNNIEESLSKKQKELTNKSNEFIIEQYQEIAVSMTESNDNIKEKIEIFSSKLTDKIEKENEKQRQIIEDLNKRLEKRDTDMCNKLKESMDRNKQVEEEKNKGFWSRILKK